MRTFIDKYSILCYSDLYNLNLTKQVFLFKLFFSAFKPIFATNQSSKSKSEFKSSSDRRSSYEYDFRPPPVYNPYPPINNYGMSFSFET